MVSQYHPGVPYLTYSLCAIVKGPNGAVEVDLVAEGVWKRRTLRNGGSNSGFEEIHNGEPQRPQINQPL